MSKNRNRKLEDLRAQAERLSDPQDKKAALELDADAIVLEETFNQFDEQLRHERRMEVTTGVLASLLLLYLLLSGTITRTLFGVFSGDGNYVLWDRQPDLFAFTAIFYGAVLFWFSLLGGWRHCVRNKAQARAEVTRVKDEGFSCASR